jgi:hypothetical protein
MPASTSNDPTQNPAVPKTAETPPAAAPASAPHAGGSHAAAPHGPALRAKDHGAVHRIEIYVHEINQLFNSMDPSPFHEKDLDHDAEEFIVSWAQEFPINAPLTLLIHLRDFPATGNPRDLIATSIHNYFSYRAKINTLEFRRLMDTGRTSLIIGVLFLAGCLLTSELLAKLQSASWAKIIREGLTIAGWVAMWRPMQIYLYDWWPVRRRGKIFDKLGHCKVEVRKSA